MDNFGIALFFIINELTVLGRVIISFEACCQWALLSVQIIIYTVTLPSYYIYCTEVH